MAKLTFQLSEETKTVISLLRSLNVGDILPYPLICSSLGYPGIETCRPAMASAQRVLLHEEGFIYGTVRKVGLKRLNDPEKVEKMGKITCRARTTSKRGKELSFHVDFSQLTDEQRQECMAYQTVNSAFIEMTKSRRIQQLKIALPVTKEPVGLPPAKALEIIKDIILKG